MTQIHLYDTMRRAKVPFEPIDPKNVRLYVCGPTVYDNAHIGNARPVVVFDVLFRLLRHVYGEEHVTYVRNITDVDDKINARAARDFPDLPLNDAIARVTEKTTAQFHADAAALGCLLPTHEPRATQHIDGMVAMIETLIEKGHAYVATGGKGREVLFDVTSDADYGALSNRKLEAQQAGARVAVEGHKRNAGDFVLWKESAADEPGWDARFDGATIRGRPGWHIECSAMSKHHLGETFDIHGGGLDLIFPHHENEIAQSCCAASTPDGAERMANVWMHNGYLQVEGRKMSKSEGNFVTISDLLHTEKVGGRKWPGEVVRLALLMTHYREPIDFSVRRLEEADRTLVKLRRAVDRRYLGIEPVFVPSDLEDDLQTAAAIGEAVQLAKSALRTERPFFDKDGEVYAHVEETVAEKSAGRSEAILRLLGFALDDRSPAPDNIVEIIRRRADLIAAKNWPAADRIRDELLADGIQLKDGRDPDTGERTATWEFVR